MSALKSLSTAEWRHRLGSSVWLFFFLQSLVPDDWDGSPTFVWRGQLFTDLTLAQALDVRPSTIANWRRTLRRNGLLRWAREPNVSGYYLILQGARSTTLAAETVKPEESQAARETRTADGETVKSWTN